MLKALMKIGIEGMYLNIVKAIYDKPIANIILSGEKLKPLLLKSRMRQGCPLVPLLFDSVGIPSQSNKAGRRNKRIYVGKEVIKLSLYQKTRKTPLPKTPGHYKQLWQNNRIQIKFTIISSLSVHQQ
jgi:hypothetical protein